MAPKAAGFLATYPLITQLFIRFSLAVNLTLTTYTKCPVSSHSFPPDRPV